MSADADGSVRVWDSSLDGFTGFGTAQASFTISLSPRSDQRELEVDVPVRVAWIPTEEDQILSDQRCGPDQRLCE